MFPIALDLTKTKILLIGQGEALEKRHAQLLQYGASKLTIFNDYQKIYDCPIVMIAGLSRAESEKISAAARADGKMVNVEDMNDLCDFYFTANVKRGDLLIAVSTGGASPTLARRVRDYIGNRFGSEWAEYTNEIGAHRTGLKAQGKSMKEVLSESESFLAEKGWLSCVRCPKKENI